MATRRKHRKGPHHTKRRRVGATGKHWMKDVLHVLGQGVAAAVGGGVAVFGVNAVKTGLSAQITAGHVPMWAPPAGVGLAGVGVAYFGRKMPYVPEFGIGMAAVGGVMVANEAGLNMPGIAGLAMASNAPVGTSAFTKAVGYRAMGCQRMGSGPSSYMSKTVGGRRPVSAKAVGTLVSD